MHSIYVSVESASGDGEEKGSKTKAQLDYGDKPAHHKIKQRLNKTVGDIAGKFGLKLKKVSSLDF